MRYFRWRCQTVTKRRLFWQRRGSLSRRALPNTILDASRSLIAVREFASTAIRTSEDNSPGIGIHYHFHSQNCFFNLPTELATSPAATLTLLLCGSQMANILILVFIITPPYRWKLRRSTIIIDHQEWKNSSQFTPDSLHLPSKRPLEGRTKKFSAYVSHTFESNAWKLRRTKIFFVQPRISPFES